MVWSSSVHSLTQPLKLSLGIFFFFTVTASNMSRIMSGSHCDLDRRARERGAMHFVGAPQQLYNYIISHLNKLPCFCCQCVNIHSDFYPGEEMQFKQWGTQKQKTNTMMKRITRREKKQNISRKDQTRLRICWIIDGIFEAHFVLLYSQRWMSARRVCTQTPTTSK